MTITDPGTGLRRYLPDAREAVRWKPDGLPERDLRRLLTPTGTNQIGPAGPDTDHWAAVADTCRAAWTHADATAEELPPDAVGRVPRWSGPDAAPSRCRVPIHLTAGTTRHVGRAGHVGHAYIVREPIDDAVGHRPGDGRMPATDDTWWSRYRERAAAAAGQN
ncbi:hypothetical protein [Kitasatospora griseola]|uniref:hypothetical protein n=1 Tax=Kitasatospora griseola TaxID=2064 RepID=UPI0034295F3F